MKSILHLGRLAVCCMAFVWPAFAQLDSAALRERFGAPLNRETFHLLWGFDLVVDYGANHQVCKLQVPAQMPTDEKISNSDVTRQRMYAFLSELVPASIRGRETGRFHMATGAPSFLLTEYEHVSVGESQDANQPFGGTITLTFKADGCAKAGTP